MNEPTVQKALKLCWVSLMLLGSASSMTAEQYAKVEKMATAVARTEGFYVKNSLPNRLCNPGDIKSTLKNAYPGQVGLYHGYAVFKSDYYGWSALIGQIRRIIDGTSRMYTQDMTFAQIAKVYAASPQWLKTLCKILQVTPDMTLNEFFNLPPRLLLTRETIHGKLPVWTYGSPQMPILQQMPLMLAQVR